MDEQAIALLREIREDLRVIRAAVERSSVPPVDHDARTLAFMRALYTDAGDTGFTGVEIAEHAQLDECVGLYEAIIDVVGELNPKKIGRLLRRLEGHAGEYLIWRIGADRDGVVWRIAPLKVEKA